MVRNWFSYMGRTSGIAISEGKLNTRKGKVRTADAAATPPIMERKNERLSMGAIIA